MKGIPTPGVLAPDPALPHRDRLLDGEVVGRHLRAALAADGGAPVGACELVRAGYRIGRSLQLLHRIRIGSRWQWISGRAFRDGRAAKAFRRAAAAAPPSYGLPAVVHDPELGAVFWTFPNDRRLTGLGRLLAGAGALAREWRGPGAGVRVVGYKPEKSVVLELLDEAGRSFAFAKVYGDGTGEQAWRIHTDLAAQVGAGHPHLRVPPPIACVAGRRMLVLEAIDGRRIADLGADEAASAIARLGAALATFHALAPPAESPRFSRADPDRLAAAAAVLGRARPAVAGAAEALAAALARRFEPAAEPPVCLHGDVHVKNGILAGDRVALVDLDKACVGEPAVDLGSFLSLLRSEWLLGRLDRTDVARWSAALVDGYARLRPPPDARRLRWHTAAALLGEQAIRAVRRIRPKALARLDLLLADARHLLEEPADG